MENQDSLVVISNGVQYIHPDCLLTSLQNRARLLADKAAQPGLDLMSTENYRGQRVAALALIQELTEALNGR